LTKFLTRLVDRILVSRVPISFPVPETTSPERSGRDCDVEAAPDRARRQRSTSGQYLTVPRLRVERRYYSRAKDPRTGTRANCAEETETVCKVM